MAEPDFTQDVVGNGDFGEGNQVAPKEESNDSSQPHEEIPKGTDDNSK